MFSRRCVFCFPVLAMGVSLLAASPEESEAASWGDLYEVGQALFDEYAPTEIKEAHDFPTSEQWNAFAVRFQQALADESLEELAGFQPEAQAALAALQVLPGSEDYTDWMRERLDYVEAAKATVQPAPRVPPVVRPEIPHLALWRERLQTSRQPDRAEALMPLLSSSFAAEGLPGELAWMAEAESSFNPQAKSPVGARGLFQFMPATAKEMGLSTFLPDERTDPEKSARAAAQYLKRLHAQFGSWPLALAAYNAGGGRVGRTLTKMRATTFAEISADLPSETRMYVPKVLATLEARSGTKWELLPPPRS